MSESNQDARHPVTQTRLLQAQREGNIPRSNELASSFQLICGLGVLYFSIQSIGNRLVESTSKLWSTATISSDKLTEVQTQIATSTTEFSVFILPLLLAFLLAGVASHLVQNPNVNFGRSLLRFETLNPLNGIKRLFSFENLMRSILGLPKILILSAVFLMTIWQQRVPIAELSYKPTAEVASGMFNCVFSIIFTCAITLFVTSLLDYIIARYMYFQRLRMTDQELRDESRLQQIDPQIFNRRTQIRQNLMR